MEAQKLGPGQKSLTRVWPRKETWSVPGGGAHQRLPPTLG